MKSLKVRIDFEIKEDASDDDAVKQAVYDFLSEAIEMDELSFVVEDDEADEEDYQ